MRECRFFLVANGDTSATTLKKAKRCEKKKKILYFFPIIYSCVYIKSSFINRNGLNIFKNNDRVLNILMREFVVGIPHKKTHCAFVLSMLLFLYKFRAYRHCGGNGHSDDKLFIFHGHFEK